MGTVASKGPNINETDKTSPRYTELSNFHKSWINRGYIGDADLLLDLKSIESVKRLAFDNVEVGDLAVISNRRGMVTSVTKVLNVVTEIEVDENAQSMGLKESEVRTYYIGKENNSLNAGDILIYKQNTSDPNTWPKSAQDAAAYQNKF